MKNAFLIGEKIYLRPIDREDAAQLQAFMNDPEVTQTLGAYRPLSMQRELDFIEQTNKDKNQVWLGIVLKQDDRLIGTVALRAIQGKDRKADFGIKIGFKEEWNKGYGTEATKLIVRHGFETLNLNKVWLKVFEYNARAMRAYEKAGFSREGLLRQDDYRMGRYWDTVIMGILREDWNKLRG
jgi:[ribosomal protein S5]-alanine N-acetyltransferase